MKWRYILWGGLVLLVLAVVAVVVPGSPVYLPDLMLAGGQHDGHSTRYWTQALDDPDPQARREAIKALSAIGPEAERAVPRLAAIMLEDPDLDTRIDASLALSKLDPATKAVVPQLVQALTDPEPYVRMNAARALHRLGTDARPAVPTLIRGIKDPANDTNLNTFTYTIQHMMVLALGRASAGTDEGVEPLIEVLTTGSTVALRRQAARALGDVGPPAKAAAPHLRAMLKDKNVHNRNEALEALKKIGEPAEVPG